MRRSLISMGFAVAVSVASSASGQDSVGLGDGSDGTVVVRAGYRPEVAYVPIRSATGAALVAAEGPSGFSDGDAVIVLQSGFDADAREAEAQLGRMFVTRIATIAGDEIALAETPPWDVLRGAQLVRVFEADDFLIESGEDWYVDHFDGAKQGILAVFARDEIRIDADIELAGGGYRAGGASFTAELPECGMAFVGADYAGRGGGGAIFYTSSTCGALYGCGADPLGLGGGAAPAFGMGGGGGGNGGAGGSAYHPPGCTPGLGLAAGARAAPVGADQVVHFGGAGGAAALIDFSGSLEGGFGGGVIILRGARIRGSGGLNVDGRSGGGGGGGGAGGTIWLQSAGELSLCEVYARGGAAGDFSGAGGGGRIVVMGDDTSCFREDLVARGDASMPGGIAEDGVIERLGPFGCDRCDDGGIPLGCDDETYACFLCSAAADCDAYGPSFACAGDGTCHDACAGLCDAAERCVPTPAGGYECASTNGCTVDGECRLGLCDVAVNVCVPGACRIDDDCAAGSRCDPDPAHPDLGSCVRAGTPPGTPPPSGQISFLGGGGCSTAGAQLPLAGLALALLALRSVRRRRR